MDKAPYWSPIGTGELDWDREGQWVSRTDYDRLYNAFLVAQEFAEETIAQRESVNTPDKA